MSKENTEKNLKKLLRGERACIPGNFLRIPKQRNGGTVLNYGKGVPLSQGQFGVTYRGSINANGKRYVVYKEIKIDPKDTTPGAFEFEFKVAQKLRGFSVPDTFLFKKCPIQNKEPKKIHTNDGRVIQPEKRTQAKDIIYMELIDGESFYNWYRKTNPSLSAVKSVITQVFVNLNRIHKQYPKFRHRDLHTGNVMVSTTGKKSKYTWGVDKERYEQENPGVTAYIIDFGLSYWSERMPNPETDRGGYEHVGIYKNTPGSIYYDTHRFLYSIYRTIRRPVNAKERAIKNFIEELVPDEYLDYDGKYTFGGCLLTHKLPRVTKLPKFKDILSHPFLTGEKKKTLSKTLKMIPKAKTPVKAKTPPKPKTKTPSPKISTAEREKKIKKAAAVLAAKPKPKQPLRRPGVPRPNPVPEIRTATPTPRPNPVPEIRTATPTPKAKTPGYKFTNIKGKERVFKSKAWYEKALAKNKAMREERAKPTWSEKARVKRYERGQPFNMKTPQNVRNAIQAGKNMKFVEGRFKTVTPKNSTAKAKINKFVNSLSNGERDMLKKKIC